jgi:hypothetical protein
MDDLLAKSLWDYSREDTYDHGNKETNTEWKYRINNKILYLSFKYTDSDQDWQQNFMFFAFPRHDAAYKDMVNDWYAHYGFRMKWKAIEDEISNIIEQNKALFTTIYITGHSQGGAIVVLAHEYVHYNYPDKTLISVTFGAPRVIYKKNFNKIKDRFDHIIHYRRYGDIVTWIPFKWMGYKETGSIAYRGPKPLKFYLIKDVFGLLFKKKKIEEINLFDIHGNYGEYLK